jgi:DNA-binding NarL/FixJ family response regulator
VNPTHQLQAINLAIWIRDNSKKVDKEVLVYNIQNLAEYGIFSNRQMQAICRNELSYTTIGGYTQKKSKSGGNFSPESLEDLRDILFSKHNDQINYKAIERALGHGTSQGMISKLTGVAQSTISKHFGG